MPVLDIQFLCFPNAKVHVWQKMAFCQHQKQGTVPVQNFQLLPSDNNMNSKYHNMHITIPVDFKILLNKIFTQAFKTPRSYFSTILYTREYIRITALGKDEGLSVSGMTSLNKLNMSVQ